MAAGGKLGGMRLKALCRIEGAGPGGKEPRVIMPGETFGFGDTDEAERLIRIGAATEVKPEPEPAE